MMVEGSALAMNGRPPSAGLGGIWSKSSANSEDDRGKRTVRMTPEVLREICAERQMWSQPSLNTQLFLNYKGFEEIAGLEEYTRVRLLHLGNNNITKIEGLDRMSSLVSLSLESNRLVSIDNLDNMPALRSLSLQYNALTSTAGISHMTKLETLNVAHNAIEDLDKVKDLQTMPSLTNVDVSHNQLEASEGVIEFWEKLGGHLKILGYNGNPGVRSIDHYRKRMVNALPSLSYFDDRPVFPVERRACKAWAEGGMQAMHKAKQDFHKERFAACALDKEVGDKLSQMRKMAIARIEREAKEREEAAAAAANRAGKEESGASAAAQDGDPEALKEYEKSWVTKVNLHGLDGVREQVANSATASAGQSVAKAMEAAAAARRMPNPAAQLDPTRHVFNPPARGTGTAPDVGRRAQQPTRAVEASDFRAGSSRTGNSAGDTGPGAGQGSRDDYIDRQFAVLGDDPWADKPSIFGQGAKASSGGLGGSSRDEDEVVPEIWKSLRPAAAAAEAEVFEMNTRASLAWRAAEAASSDVQNELTSLD